MSFIRRRTGIASLAVAAALGVSSVAIAQDATDRDADSISDEIGNMIFIHPDGTDAAYWHVARTYYEGPDGIINWDRLPVVVPYRGHMADELTATSNGGATVHAFGFKVDGPESYGQDTGAANVLAGDFPDPDPDDDLPPAREILGLSGYPGSWLREACNAGYPCGVVNDGDAAEPGTGVFLAEVPERGGGFEFDVVAQHLKGRPGFQEGDATEDRDPEVMMFGGESLFLPEGTPYCTEDQAGTYRPDGWPIATYPPSCAVHRPAEDYTTYADDGSVVYVEDLPTATEGDDFRPDGENLLVYAVEEDYLLVRTRAEFEALVAAIEAGNVDPAAIKVLGIFADEDIFNDTSEENLIEDALVDPEVSSDAKDTNLVLYGAPRGTPGYNPPTPAEMADAATMILDAHSEEAGLPFATVWEVEGTDNFANANNAIGSIVEAKHADEMIGVARTFIGLDPNTHVLTAADSTAGGMHLREYFVHPDGELPGDTGWIGPEGATQEWDDFEELNPGIWFGGDDLAVGNPVDGRYGRLTEPFLSEEDQFGQQMPFGVSWVATPDFGGGIVTRAEGLYSEVIAETLYDRFDNVDVYRMAYLVLFGEGLPYPQGVNAPTRPPLDELDVEPGEPEMPDISILEAPPLEVPQP